MKRLCIYVIYDKQNIVNPYIENVIREIDKFVQDIYVVCNFEYIVDGQQYIEPYVKGIICRENKGYDAGAYKDALNDYITWDNIKSYDELIITNDSYFGPLYPFDDMFSTMQKAECEYWGITKHPASYNKEIGYFDEHIQSYFMCFKNNILTDKRFKGYWDDYKCFDGKELTIVNFEIGLNRYLQSIGYKGLAYMDTRDLRLDIEDCNPYSKYSLELIRDGKIPIIKKTNFYGRNRWFLNTIEAVQFIIENCDYDVSLITNYVEEYKKKGLLGPYYDFEKMDDFVKNHNRIYIYGAGNWGHMVADYLSYRNLNFESFVVTKSEAGETEFKSLIINQNDGIIIAQEYPNICKEILEYIRGKVKADQIFLPIYPEGITNGDI